MSDYRDFKNLGRQGEANTNTGTWPNGEGQGVRARYDEILQMGTTKICYACRGSGTSSDGKKKCGACKGSGSVPSAG